MKEMEQLLCGTKQRDGCFIVIWKDQCGKRHQRGQLAKKFTFSFLVCGHSCVATLCHTSPFTHELLSGLYDLDFVLLAVL